MHTVSVDPKGSTIAVIKVFTKPCDLGSKLTGIRCYNDENEIILSNGWFQDSECQKFELKPFERVTGIKGYWHPARKGDDDKDFVPNLGATLYDVQFRIFDTT